MRRWLQRSRVWMRSHQRATCWLTFGMALLLVALFALFPRSWSDGAQAGEGDWTGARIWVVHSSIHWVLLFFAVVFSIAAISLADSHLVLRRCLYPILVGLHIVVVCPVACLVHCGVNILHWETMDSVDAPGGHAYYFMDSSFLQGQTLCLARFEGLGLVTRRLRVLVCTNGDSPRTFLPMVRPANDAGEHNGDVRVCGDHVVVFRGSSDCYLAYNRRTGRAYWGDRLFQLSPFVCLGPEDKLAPEDVTRVKEVSPAVSPENGDEPSENYPYGNLRQGLQHRNPRARALARELLR